MITFSTVAAALLVGVAAFIVTRVRARREAESLVPVRVRSIPTRKAPR